MAKKGCTPEQIINKLREAEILLSQGETIAVVSKKIGVSAHTYFRWRKEYGGMRLDQAKRLKELEQENSRLKKLVAFLLPFFLPRYINHHHNLPLLSKSSSYNSLSSILAVQLVSLLYYSVLPLNLFACLQRYHPLV